MFWEHLHKPVIHLIGIGGSGMSGIAEVLLASQFSVSGSDLTQTPTTKRLEALGAKIFKGHASSHVERATCVVVSSAIREDNPEWVEARRRGIPVIPRAEMLAELMRLKMGIAVAGSHGKTTTTSMLGQILRSIDPTVVVGGRLQHWNASSVVGKGNAFVIEADESDRSFLKFSPVYSIVTNIDREHLDAYKDLSDIENTFLEFLNRTAFFGQNWISSDCESLLRIQKGVVKPLRTYGFHPDSDLRIVEYTYADRWSRFRLQMEGQEIEDFELPVAGRHNVQNATGAIGVALSLGLSISKIRESLKDFIPADRRLQIHYEDERVSVVEDYGHHPTEIRATLEALTTLYPSRRKVVVFQPHRYTRTQALWKEFLNCFENDVDFLHLLPIYPAHENAIVGVDSYQLSQEMIVKEVRVHSRFPSAEELASEFASSWQSSTVLLILGAGPLSALAVELSSHFQTDFRRQSLRNR